MIKEEDHIWHLIALQLAGEACNEELQELDHLLKVNPDKYYIHEILYNAWGIQEVKNKEETAQAFKRLLKKMETHGMNIIPYSAFEKPQWPKE